MSTLLVITLVVAIPAYALLWHNQPARTRQDKTRPIEAAFTFLFNPYWATRMGALVAHWVASNIVRSLKKLVAQVSKPVVSPASKSAEHEDRGKAQGFMVTAGQKFNRTL